MKTKQQRSPPPLPSISWHTWAALGWAAFVLIIHFYHFNRDVPISVGLYLKQLPSEITIGPHFVSFWAAHLLRMVGCVLLFIGAWALGRLIIHKFILTSGGHESQPLIPVFSLGLGLGIVGYVGFLLFALGIGQRAAFLGVYGGLCIFGIFTILRTKQEASSDSSPNAIEKIAGAFILLVLLFAVLATTQPEISYDALVYHLAVPQTYLHAGKLVDMPYNHYSYLPLLTSMLYSWGLAIDGMYFAKLINLGIGFSIFMALYLWGKLLRDRLTGLIAGAIFLGTPLVLYLFRAVNSDLGTSLFFLLAAAAAWIWITRQENAGGMLALAGIFSGFAIASKYSAAFGVLVLTLAIAWKAVRERQAKSLLLYGALIALPLIPWLTRNYIYTGNPVYPYMAERWGPATADLELLRDWKNETKDASPGFQPLSHLKKLWRDAGTGYSASTFNYAGPLFIGLIMLVFSVGETRIKVATLAILAAIFLGLSKTYITRLLLSNYTLLALVLGYAAVSLFERPLLKKYLTALIFMTLALNFYHLSYLFLFTTQKGLSVASGKMTTGEYLKIPRNLYPNPSYGAYEFVRQLKLPSEEKTLVVGEARGFYLSNLSIVSAPHNIPALFAWANDSKDAADLNEKLERDGIRLIVSNAYEGSRIDLPKYVTPKAHGTISTMLDRYYELVYADTWAQVFRRKS